MNSFIPWVGGKRQLLWLIWKLAPENYDRFIDVFGGSGTVILNHPRRNVSLEVYNDYNKDLVNLFRCVKNRPMALLEELRFLPLNCRDEFEVLVRFFKEEEFPDEYLEENLELVERYFEPPEAEILRQIILEKATRTNVKRAANYFKLIRYSFSGGGKSFGGKGVDLRRFFHLIWSCSRRLEDVCTENRDFEDLIRQYDRPDAFFYCDPPYYQAEGCYTVEFPKTDHIRLHDALTRCKGFVMVSYNFCPFICELYKDFFIFRTTRPNSMSQRAGSEYEEAILTNYDPRKGGEQLSIFPTNTAVDYELVHVPERTLKQQ